MLPKGQQVIWSKQLINSLTHQELLPTQIFWLLRTLIVLVPKVSSSITSVKISIVIYIILLKKIKFIIKIIKSYKIKLK